MPWLRAAGAISLSWVVYVNWLNHWRCYRTKKEVRQYTTADVYEELYSMTDYMNIGIDGVVLDAVVQLQNYVHQPGSGRRGLTRLEKRWPHLEDRRNTTGVASWPRLLHCRL